jgi:hypothetical protein
LPLFLLAADAVSALKDSKSNYYLRREDGRLDYYTAIRIQQALENAKLLRLVKQGTLCQEDLMALECRALDTVRAYDRGEAEMEEALAATLAYGTPAILGMPVDQIGRSRAIERLRSQYHRTLSERPWKRCPCVICQALSVEVTIFRGSNRNKRRGIHNLGVFKAVVYSLPQSDAKYGQINLFGDTCPQSPP